MRLTIAILLFQAASFGFAQQQKIPFEKYSVAEGLPEEFVRSIVQDDKGFIWFGTQNGLVKYDGYHFKVYGPSSGKTDTTGFKLRNLGGGLVKARDGKIWIGESLQRGGLACFDPATEKFRTYYAIGNQGKNTDDGFSILLFEDLDGNIWFKCGQQGKMFTCRLNPLTGIIKRFPLVDLLGNNTFFTVLNTIEWAGTIWLLDDKKNLNRLNRQKDSFEIIIPAGSEIFGSGKTDTIRWLSAESNNRITLSGSHGIYVCDIENQKIVKSYVHDVGSSKSLPDSVMFNVKLLNGQNFLVHPNGKFSLIDPVSDMIETFQYGNGPIPFQKGIEKVRFFMPIEQDKEGVWVYVIGGPVNGKIPVFFLYYKFADKKFTLYDYNFNLPGNPFPPFLRAMYNALKDKTGLLWLATRPGLYKQAPKKHQMDLFRYDAKDPGGIPSDTIHYLFEDSRKRLWVSTSNGLALYQPGEYNFRIFRNDPSKATSLSNNRVNMVQEDSDGRIWVGTANGLNQWQESTGNFKRFFFKPGEINAVEFIFPDKQKRLWLSLWDKGVYVLEKNTGRVLKSFLPDADNPASLTSNRIDFFYQDSKGTVWLGDGDDNQFGLYKLNPAEDGFTHFMPIGGDSTSLSSNEIRFIGEDGKQRLWIGTDGGLNLYKYDQNNFIRFRNHELTSVNFIAIDRHGEPWFATYSGGGLVTVDVDQGIITAVGESRGLLHNDISPGINGYIAKDDYGRFWLPNQRGLSVFDPETESFLSYFEKDGFQHYGRSYRVLSTHNGDIWIGGNFGLNHIVPSTLLKKDTTLPSIVITQVTINDSVYSKPDGTIFKQSVAYTNSIELAYWQKDISFDFVALHYLRSEDNQYSWKLENYDEDWSSPSKERSVSYTNLSPGEYIFRVKASNADGAWNEEGISFSIRILPPWWLTWWAYALYALFFICGFVIFNKWREKRLRFEKEQLQHKVEERTAELKQSLENLQSTQAQLIQSEKMASLGELTAGIAHEIQNPLNFVNNFSEVSSELVDEMKEEFTAGNSEAALEIADDLKQNLEKIHFHGKRADGIVKGMLQHSRSGSGRKEPTDINALADEYLRLAYHGLRAKDKSFNARMKTEFDETIGSINIIPQDIGRVILNLITNAFYAVNEKSKQNIPGYEPTVEVSTRKEGNEVSVRVKDNGSGIPPKILDKIFQPFFTTKPTGQGTGLGLSISYDVVKAHGGSMKVETTQDEGTVFIIHLPADA